MSDQLHPLTPRHLRAVVYHVALVYLEVERGLRPHQHLAKILTPPEYRRHLITRRRGITQSTPVRPHDIGRVRIDHATPHHVKTNIPVRRGEGWGTLIVDLQGTDRGWQVERLGRLERLLPSEPRDVNVDEDALARRARFIEEQRRWVARAHKAATTRYERSQDKRTRAARQLRRERDRWASRLAKLETEAAALHERRRLQRQHAPLGGHTEPATCDPAEGPNVEGALFSPEDRRSLEGGSERQDVTWMQLLTGMSEQLDLRRKDEYARTVDPNAGTTLER